MRRSPETGIGRGPPRAMNLSNLRAFAAVAQTGNITQAARFLHLSQPAVSGQIRALEEELGETLFEHTPVGAKLTRFGEEILADAERVNATVNGMLHAPI